MKFSKIIGKLEAISIVSTYKKESWSNLTLCGIYSENYSKTYFSEIYESFNENGIPGAITLCIDNEPYGIDEFIDTLSNGEEWSIYINKNVWLDKLDANGIIHTFFLLKDDFLKWAKDTDPFLPDNPLNENRIHVYVLDLEESFGGPNFFVNNSDDIEGWIPDIDISTELIESTIRIRYHDEFIIAPQKHVVTIGMVTDSSKWFFRNSISVLLLSLCNEVLSNQEIIIKGHRIIRTQLGVNNFSKEDLYDYQKTLISIVKWVFEKEENCSVKKNLFTDRVSLDLDSGINLYDGLKNRLQDIAYQIREQYQFILLDRKTEYQSELKDLLNDIKSITDNISNKVRSILSNLLRDVLAALVLVGITLFSQIDDLRKLSENNLINYVFAAFGIYFIVSIILQVVFDYMDIKKSTQDLEYWKNITHNYISKTQFDTYKQENLEKRFKYMAFYYIIIILFYVGISITCFKYSSILSYFLAQPYEVENNNQKSHESQRIINKDSLTITKINNDTIIRSNNK